LATSLKTKFGITKGDMVIICSPNLIESVLMILALTRLGAVHYVVRDYYRSQNLATNINDLKPKLIVASTTHLKDGDKVHKVTDLMRAALILVD